MALPRSEVNGTAKFTVGDASPTYSCEHRKKFGALEHSLSSFCLSGEFDSSSIHLCKLLQPRLHRAAPWKPEMSS